MIFQIQQSILKKENEKQNRTQINNNSNLKKNEKILFHTQDSQY